MLFQVRGKAMRGTMVALALLSTGFTPSKMKPGVGYILHRSAVHLVDSRETLSTRLAILRLHPPCPSDNLNCHCYSQHATVGNLELCGHLEEVILTAKSFYKFVIGDFNAGIGKGTDEDRRIGTFARCDENGDGNCPIDLMSRLYHGNSLLEKKERRQLDAGISRANAEIDHIQINRKWCLDPEDRCKETVDPGPCQFYQTKWFWDEADESCKEFHYGGCMGNKNRFNTKHECLKQCRYKLFNPVAVPDRVFFLLGNFVHGKVNGANLGHTGALLLPRNSNGSIVMPREQMLRKELGEGVKLLYKGDDGKRNGVGIAVSEAFRPLYEGSRWDNNDLCLLEPDPGNCGDERLGQWWYYFNSDLGTCEKFFFYGCGGNDNKFYSLHMCNKVCGERLSPQIGVLEEDGLADVSSFPETEHTIVSSSNRKGTRE
ncbi:unnamed protein product [Nippostrongylus brasiliensis]|uniref:BPTI/Kunitz inhibitor domain-containing protein n=1 Tax=Nippostrongylus brasiliensis TaxID=27835 RepID=A0A0N4YS10_NIPBR|nr:unnamed protein product [Nippostrongylus brasiliensis]